MAGEDLASFIFPNHLSFCNILPLNRAINVASIHAVECDSYQESPIAPRLIVPTFTRPSNDFTVDNEGNDMANNILSLVVWNDPIAMLKDTYSSIGVNSLSLGDRPIPD